MESSNQDEQLLQLFKTIDTDNSGFIGIEEVTAMCLQFGASENDANEIFEKLDRDQDGQVSFEDFKIGFDDYEKGVLISGPMSPDALVPPKFRFFNQDGDRNHGDQDQDKKNKRKSSVGAQVDLNHHDVNSNLDNSMIQELIESVNKLKKENELLADSWIKDKKINEKLAEEMDQHVQQVELRVKNQAEQKIEQERKSFRGIMKDELEQLQDHLDMFQKVDKWMKENSSQNKQIDEKVIEFQTKLEQAIEENRQMRYAMLDKETTIALMRSDYAQLKIQYDDKCKELLAERARIMDEQEHLTNQIHILVDANRRLQDTNDMKSDELNSYTSLASDVSSCASTSNLHQNQNQSIPKIIKRGSIIGNYMTNEINSNNKINYHNSKSILQSLKSQDEETEDEVQSSKSLSNIKSNHDIADNDAQTNSSSVIYDIDGPPDRTFKVIFVGDSNVGKSSFVLRITSSTFSPNLSSTLGIDFQVKSMKINNINVALQLWDTAGQERFRSLTRTYYRKVDGIILLYDVSNPSSFMNVRSWISDIEEQVSSLSDPKSRIPLILIGNKIDLRESAHESKQDCFVTSDQGSRLADQINAPFIETSVKDGININRVLSNLVIKMIQNEDAIINQGIKLSAKDEKKRWFSCCSK